MRKAGNQECFAPIFSCLPAFLILNHSVRLVNALVGCANPLGLNPNKGARASRPHLQSILEGRMPALPFTKASIYLRLFRTGPQDHVWIPQDFIDLGSRAAVDKALSRNCKSGLINRAGRGLYHVPRNHPALGSLGPSYNAMQDLVQRKAGGSVFSTGAHAANALGLSDQVPMKSWHLTTADLPGVGRFQFTPPMTPWSLISVLERHLWRFK